jgi:hypothetical protein
MKVLRSIKMLGYVKLPIIQCNILEDKNLRFYHLKYFDVLEKMLSRVVQNMDFNIFTRY